MKPLLHEERPFRVVTDVDTDRYGGRVYAIDRFETEEHARQMMLFSDEDVVALYRDGPGEVEVLEGEPLPTYEGEAYDRFGRPLSAEQCLEAARRAMEAREAHDAVSTNTGGRRSKLTDEDRAAIVEACREHLED